MIDTKKYIINNKKRSIITILGITVSSILLISISIMFSSFRNFLITDVKKEIGDYHVIIKGPLIKDNSISKVNYINNRNFIIYKNINKVYKNTNSICKKNKCENITYNDNLLSLYGLSKNKNILFTFKKILYFLICFISIIIFLIIYNFFKVSLISRKKDISLFKLIGANNSYLYKFYFKETLLLGLIGILFGLIFSILFCLILIKIMNNLLYEIFNGNLTLNIYVPFIIVSIVFMLLIIILSGFMPLKKLKKYKAMELFKKKNIIYDNHVKPFKLFTVYLAFINFERSREKYKSLIISIFIFCLGVNICLLILNYTLKCINNYVLIPEYDLKISTNEKYDLEKISKDLHSSKKISFNSCQVNGKIPSEYFIRDYKDNMNILVTDLGGNEVVNIVDKIGKKNNKISHLKYKRFKKMKEITFETNNSITLNNLKLSSNIPFGLKEIDEVVINLDNNDFKNICPEYTSNLFLNTNYNGINNYLNNLIKKSKAGMNYINIKKVRQIISNLVLTIKIFLGGVITLLLIVVLSSVINVTIINMNFRKREFASLLAIGLVSSKIIISLLIESILISLSGFTLSIPFIFIINKYLFISIKTIFNFKNIIIGTNNLVLSLLLSLITIYIPMLSSYLFFRKKSIISNIKYDN